MPDGFVQQDARPARTEHNIHLAGWSFAGVNQLVSIAATYKF